MIQVQVDGRFIDAKLEKHDKILQLKILMGIANCFQSSIESSLALLYGPFVTCKAGRHPQSQIVLSPRNYWQASWTIIIDPTQPHSTFHLSHSSPFFCDEAVKLRIDMWEVICDGTKSVSYQTFYYSNCN